MRPPTFHHERALIAAGYLPIGVDEAGCGPLAGPVVAAACVLPLASRIALVRDSKLLSAAQRDRVATLLAQRGAQWGIGVASVAEIDAHNIRRATYLAMQRAITALLASPRCTTGTPFVLVDAWTLPNLPFPQRGIVRGDRTVKSIAAASIIAKTYRDSLMVAIDAEHPQHGFARHKGYGTVAHLKAIAKYGKTPHHRANFC
ncbi:MAG: ribonuclease HII [bacterium]|nr:ribonuclease HII [bacterium]